MILHFALILILLISAVIPADAADIAGKVSAKPAVSEKEYAKAVKDMGRDAAYTAKQAERVDYASAGQDVVVYIEEAKGEFTPPAEPIELKQKNIEFSHSVLPILAGSTVSFPNQDNIFHNIFSYSRVKPFDLGLFRKGAAKSVTFDKPGHVPVYCAIHQNMKSDILILQNPYFAVTGKDGQYKIAGVPPGKYRLVAWKARFPEAIHEIEVKDGAETVSADLMLGVQALPKVE